MEKVVTDTKTHVIWRRHLQVLVEFDDRHWQRREWVRIHEIFQLFLVEHTIVWAERADPENSEQPISWPGLNFRTIVDKACLNSSKKKPIEFLSDKFLGLVDDRSLKSHSEGDENKARTLGRFPETGLAIKAWQDYQDGQKILLTTPSVLVGYRVEVYRAEGTTQWYTAVIQSYNHTTKTLSVTDDTVLEEHNEDPALIQMRLIDDGVVDSILRGVEVGIGPRRTRQTNKDKDLQSTSAVLFYIT
ncbi:probable JmjC domain-containing histone demethylation protein 2C [Argopecten irradians]|uniref:probable JmjC domain-containing histone demethylation protein 2C n=1 Tax=Argopecten irradians TaxID=31199 RepID=UPI003721E416